MSPLGLVPIYKLPTSALKAIFGDQTATLHIGPDSWVEFNRVKYMLPPDPIREKMRRKIVARLLEKGKQAVKH